MPTLSELAVAAPAVSLLRRHEVPDTAVLELTWSGPAVGAAVPGTVCLEAPPTDELPLEAGAAAAVVLIDPPAGRGRDVLAEAARVATAFVIAVAPLASFDGATAAELAPSGWSGSEAEGPGDILLSLTEGADDDEALTKVLGPAALEHRERWLSFFASGAFGAGRRRLWVWRREQPAEMPAHVRFDPARVRPWRPVAPPMSPPPRAGLLRRAWKRADLLERARVHTAMRRHARARAVTGPVG